MKRSAVLVTGRPGDDRSLGIGQDLPRRTLAKILDVPFAYNDATAFTESAYYGEDAEVAIGKLLFARNQNVDAARKASSSSTRSTRSRGAQAERAPVWARDIGGEGVQQSLLKILKGEKLFVPLNVTSHWNKYDYVEIDIANILFICAGAWSSSRTMCEE